MTEKRVIKMEQQWINKALKTWKSSDNDLEHALVGIMGETGELADLYKKETFKKAGYYFRCECGHLENKHKRDPGCFGSVYPPCPCKEYYPHVYAELGDISYYVRVAFHLLGEPPVGNVPPFEENVLKNLANIQKTVGEMLLSKNYQNFMHDIYFSFLNLCTIFDIRAEKIYERNYKKLNKEGFHGWAE